ncbi:amidohydrolase family protein [Nocardia sp. NPDC006630]|uniref:amidohydrolase family protein n=1 Tax=Nocardia sp. NPDC006630 TaxID=3157181 RepID=UPI0033B9A957
MLIRRARVFGTSFTDVRFDGGRITECGIGLRPLPNEDDIDARGCWLLPGLHDHHVHLRSLAATSGSVRVGPAHVSTLAGLTARLFSADSELPAGVWIRGVDYHESVAGSLDRRALDRIVDSRPVRIQHRSGALWMLNSAACTAVDLDECRLPGVERDAAARPTGRLWRLDGWLGTRTDSAPVDLTDLSTRAARLGITGFTDATPAMGHPDIDDFAESVAAGRIRQRLHCMAPPGITDPGTARFSLGPTKILLDDTTLPELDDFIDRIRAVHAAGRPIAVHCVTRVQLALTIAALDSAGVRRGDRIEHGALIPVNAMAWLREHHVPVITQPHFPVERAEQYRREVPHEDQPDLWRLGSLMRAGVPVAASTDAPFGTPNPWSAIRAAVHRMPWGAGELENIPLSRALSLFFGAPEQPDRPRRIVPGEVADLTLLGVPPEDLRAGSPTPAVTATIVDGKPVHLMN